MKYLSPQDILVIHAKIIDETGGLHEVRDVGLLASIGHKPKTTAFGKEVYVNVFEKEEMVSGIFSYHEFEWGLRRSAVEAVGVCPFNYLTSGEQAELSGILDSMRLRGFNTPVSICLSQETPG